MKRILFTLAIVFAALLSEAQIIVSGEITSNTTWTNDNIYLLSGFVYVRNGATLTIEPGTLIKGDFTTKGSLIVERGGKLIADGTPNQPIVFTSQKAPGQRSYGDWGGVILCGRASVNAPANAGNGTAAGEAIIEGGVGSIYGGGATPDDNDNSGILRYVRIEFGGIPFQPNNEINGLTCGGVGRGTIIENVMVSYSGDDAFEWFGGTVNAKNLIAYRNWDDDFDTDFGYQGKLQFLLSVRDPAIADQSGSNGFESDNDATGTTNVPNTHPVFSNVTIIGPYVNNATTINSNFKRGAHLRRNTSCSIFNTVIAGYPTGLLIEAATTQTNATNGDLRVRNLVLAQMADTLATVTTANPNNVNGSFDISAWYNTSGWGNETYSTAAELLFNSTTLSNPNLTLQVGSVLNSGASFTDTQLSDSFFTPVNYRGAFGADDWTSCWAEWDPQNAAYNASINNVITASIQAAGATEFCAGGNLTLNASSSDANATIHWENGENGTSRVVTSSGTYTVYAESANHCVSEVASIEVVVNPLPSVNIVANGATTFCTGGSVVLNADQNNGVVWSTSATASSITVTQSGVYTATYTDGNGCSSSSNSISVNVSDSPIPTISTSSSTTICDGESVTLSASASDSYTWNLNGNPIANEAGQTLAATEEGLYTVTVTNTDACNGVGTSSPILVSVNPSPIAQGTYVQVFGNYTIQFNNESLNATSVEWNFGDGSTSTSFNPSHTYANGGDYTVTLTATNGDCTDTFTINIDNVSVSELNVVESLSIYPNPSNGQVTLQVAAMSNSQLMVKVTDMAGAIVWMENVNVISGNQQLELNLNHLADGLYLVQLQDSNAASTMQKLLIQK